METNTRIMLTALVTMITMAWVLQPPYLFWESAIPCLLYGGIIYLLLEKEKKR